MDTRDRNSYKGFPKANNSKSNLSKPYQGGNKTLLALHHLDIVRKHKKLIEPAVLPNLVTVSAWGFQPTDVFTPVAHWITGGDGETVLGLLKKDRVDDPEIKITPYIAIYEAGPFHRREVIETIRTFATFANSAVKLFDQ